MWERVNSNALTKLRMLPAKRSPNDSTDLEVGTLAAGAQSLLYGGLVPAGGFFASLTSMGMLGTLLPLALGVSAGCAAVAGFFAWITT